MMCAYTIVSFIKYITPLESYTGYFIIFKNISQRNIYFLYLQITKILSFNRYKIDDIINFYPFKYKNFIT